MGHSAEHGDVHRLLGDPAYARAAADSVQALSTPSRLRILARLHSGPASVNEIADSVGMESSAVSHQLRLLRERQALRRRHKGSRGRAGKGKLATGRGHGHNAFGTIGMRRGRAPERTRGLKGARKQRAKGSRSRLPPVPCQLARRSWHQSRLPGRECGSARNPLHRQRPAAGAAAGQAGRPGSRRS